MDTEAGTVEHSRFGRPIICDAYDIKERYLAGGEWR